MEQNGGKSVTIKGEGQVVWENISTFAFFMAPLSPDLNIAMSVQAAREREPARFLSDGDGRVLRQGADHYGQRLGLLQVANNVVMFS